MQLRDICIHVHVELAPTAKILKMLKNARYSICMHRLMCYRTDDICLSVYLSVSLKKYFNFCNFHTIYCKPFFILDDLRYPIHNSPCSINRDTLQICMGSMLSKLGHTFHVQVSICESEMFPK